MASDAREGGVLRSSPTRELRGLQATIPVGPAAPSAARAWARRRLADQVSATVLDDALLVISELVTNSVLHAGPLVGAPIRVSAALADGTLRLEVEDAGHGNAVIRRAPDRRHGSGFGLDLVDRIAARWGVTQLGATRVWCELREPASS